MAKKKQSTCRKCRGQLRDVKAEHLKGRDGLPLVYAACPGDCAGLTKQDIQAGKVRR